MDILTNEKNTFLTLKHTKNLQAIAAIGIIFHHMAQKTCAPWLNTSVIRHGLDLFLPIGYLLVSIFFFSSGYGLYKSVHSKENYLIGFIGRHFTPIILVSIFSFVCYFLYGVSSNPYSWYITAILYLYLAFYVAFRFMKNENHSIAAILLCTILYCILCDYLVLGGWWINTVGLFTVGIIIAKNEETLYSVFSSKKILLVCIAVVLFIVLFAVSEYLNNHLVDCADYTSYTISRITVIIFQFLACLCFITVLLVISLKVQLHNRILCYVGSMTLDLYLIHGFFVQLFGYSFVSDNVAPLYYIKNVWLYAAVVLICSLLSAASIHFVRNKIMWFISRNSGFFASIAHGAVKLFLILLGSLIVFSMILMVRHRFNRDEIDQKLTAYQQENIEFVDVNGKKMALYIAGNKDSNNTIVILRSENDPCPTMTMKTLCTELQEENRIIVPDYLGIGFSDDPNSPRTIENITEEIHTGLHSLGIDAPYILMSAGLSGLYSAYYTFRYPNEVKAVVGFDILSADSIEKECKDNRISIFEYVRMRNTSVKNDGALAGFIDTFGYGDFFWPLFEQMYVKGLNGKEREIAKEIFFKRLYNRYTLEEFDHLYENFNIIQNIKYPTGIKVIDIVSTYDDNGNVKKHADIINTNSNICENPADHTVTEVVDTWYCLCYNVPTVKKILYDTIIE